LPPDHHSKGTPELFPWRALESMINSRKAKFDV
jgi:hypothetical protein